MKQFLVMFAVFLVAGDAGAVNESNIWVPHNTQSCSMVLSAHADIETTAKGWKGGTKGFRLIGYVSGWASAVNWAVKGKKDYFVGMKSTDITNWVASWCRSNPSKDLSDAMTALTDSRR